MRRLFWGIIALLFVVYFVTTKRPQKNDGSDVSKLNENDSGSLLQASTSLDKRKGSLNNLDEAQIAKPTPQWGARKKQEVSEQGVDKTLASNEINAFAPSNVENNRAKGGPTKSKFVWSKKPIEQDKIMEAMSRNPNNSPETIKETLSKLPDSFKVLEAGPGEVKVNYQEVHVISCPPIEPLKMSLVVRLDTEGNPVDVEWASQLSNKIPEFVWGCKFTPILRDGVATRAVFSWPSDAFQKFINLRVQSGNSNY